MHPMFTFSKVIADLDWRWITKMAIAVGCVDSFIRLFLHKNGRRGFLADLEVTVPFGIVLIAVLIFYHASEGALEVAFASWFGYIAAALVGLFWGRRLVLPANRKSPAKG